MNGWHNSVTVALILVNTGMTISVIFFTLGYIFRKRLKLHRPFMIMGIASNLISALILLVSVYVFHGGDRVAAGFIPVVSPFWILVHRFLASTAFVLMFAMAYTGLRHDRLRHVRLHYIFIVLYLVVYLTGLFFFRS